MILKKKKKKVKTLLCVRFSCFLASFSCSGLPPLVMSKAELP